MPDIKSMLKPAAIAAVTALLLVKFGMVGAGAKTPAFFVPKAA